ncbi:MAG: hypothetical protein IPJ71_02305 [Bdellovibrionales bacterium]|nr:hypothetical protein [Bdellovibrionales bacterium]
MKDVRARLRLDEEKTKFLQSEVTWLHEQIRSLERRSLGESHMICDSN